MEIDLKTREKIVIYQEKKEELEKKIVKLKEELHTVGLVLEDAVRMKDMTRLEHTELNQSCLYIVQVLHDMKNRLLNQNETLHAKLEGYSEFISKLQNNEQLEFDL